MTKQFTSRHAEITWTERRIRTLNDLALRAFMEGNRAKHDKLAAESDALVDRYIALGGTHYQLAA